MTGSGTISTTTAHGGAAPIKVQSALILGSSALTIGQAGEFDYSGSQAIKALREEGIRTVLINPNIATVQTSDGLADEVYFLPVTPEYVERVIEKEKPNAILLSFGGQTALNCGLALQDSGVLARHGVRVLGTNTEAIRTTEDRGIFRDAMTDMGLKVAASITATSVKEGLRAAEEIGYPVMMRSAFSLGGLGSGYCADEKQLGERMRAAFAQVPQVLIEEWLGGWKEVEYEVVRDSADNCITVCNMENLDALGIHTGESFVVAPSQTLSDVQYHELRTIAIKAVRGLGIVGECNIQYALDPHSNDYRIIEINARLSRSSALASKATGYPLAFVAAKLALGYALPEIPNKITGVTGACFEPALDYFVIKAPRWDFQKFQGVSTRLGSGMKSVGEVMAIGRGFEETLQKAIRMQDVGEWGILPRADSTFGELDDELSIASDRRMLAIGRAFQEGYTVQRVADLTHIDQWFLKRMKGLVSVQRELESVPASESLTPEVLSKAKRLGFCDAQIAAFTGRDEDDIRLNRREHGIRPVVKQIDTLAAEYPAQTNYLYLTYHGSVDDVEYGKGPAPVLVLGSGAYRIGSSVEFDWCCVTAVRMLRQRGLTTLMLNCNPETVSTDYDECDRLYFDEISYETVLELANLERLRGVVVSFGGQTPNSLVPKLHKAGLPIMGTPAESIDCAESRDRFSALCDELGIKQPAWCEASSLENAMAFADRAGYPVLVRPSYVLSGAAMAVVQDHDALQNVLQKAAALSPDHPVVISKFVEGAKEIEIDGVAADGEIVAYAISEHVENAGVHSGDATLVLPPQRTYVATIRRARMIARRLAAALKISGPFNLQLLAKNNRLMVIECNVRSSRSFPFASKVLDINLVELATRAILGERVSVQVPSVLELDYVGVKAPQFSFSRLKGVDPILGIEMASTGEVGCIGDDMDDALLKAMLSVGFRAPVRGALLSTGTIDQKAEFLDEARLLSKLGVQLFATGGTAAFLEKAGIAATEVAWPLDEGAHNATDLIQGGTLDLVVNIPKDASERELENDYRIRRAAIDCGVPLITNIQLARQFVRSLAAFGERGLPIKSWREYRGGGAKAVDETPLLF